MEGLGEEESFISNKELGRNSGGSEGYIETGPLTLLDTKNSCMDI